MCSGNSGWTCDTLLSNLEGTLGCQWDQNSAINATCLKAGLHAERESITSLWQHSLKVKFLLRTLLVWGCSSWMYTCALKQIYKHKQAVEKKWARMAIKTMCLGQCHVPVGVRKERWQGDLQACVFWHRALLTERGDKNPGWRRRDSCGEEGLAGYGHGDVEIKFYIPSCFIVPFIAEQVQGYSDLLLLVNHIRMKGTASLCDDK